MVQVGVVYKSDGNVDVRSLPLNVKLKVLISHTIDNSVFLSGNLSKFDLLKEDEMLKKVDRYTEAINSYLSDPKFDNESELYIIYNIDDQDIVKTALGHPEYSIYAKQYVKFNSDLVALQAVLSGVVILRRVL
jgi:hypothetical protein